MTSEVDPAVLNRFTLEERVGKGAYGVVFKSTDKHTGESVALKKCFDAFCNATDAQRTWRETVYLQELGTHENIVQLKHVMLGSNGRDLYLAFDIMQADLYHANKAGVLLDAHKQFIVYQLLKALKYIHSAGLLHRDVKPSNILLNTDCKVKLCDFGLCRSIVDANETGEQRRLTDYIATRWYRSPEILLGSTRYGKGIDIWSVGCILAELIRGRPLFTGSCTMNQIDRILEYTGIPSKEEVASAKSPYAEGMIESIPLPDHRKGLSELCQGASKEARDFIRCCLQFNPKERVPAETLLQHAYVSAFHDITHEPEYPHGPIRIDLEGNAKLSPKEYRDRLCHHIEQKRLAALERQRDKIRRGGGSIGAVTVPPGLVEEHDDTAAALS